jgi:SAM-dependent methyltransferase
MSGLSEALRRLLQNASFWTKPFQGSGDYWQRRYARGGDSGAGSYGSTAAFKAQTINAFVAREQLQTVVEFGCGDGNQLTLARYPRYQGFDVSAAAVARCRERFASDASKSFDLVGDYRGQQAELALSLDVIYHLVEDATFEAYLRTLFGAATRYVVIYSTDSDRNPWYRHPHVRHRHFSRWIAQHLPAWQLAETVPPGLPGDGGRLTTDFYIYRPVSR